MRWARCLPLLAAAALVAAPPAEPRATATRDGTWRLVAAESFAANVLLLAGAVIAGRYPRTNDSLRRAGFDVREIDASELAKAEGGVTCCSIIV